MSCVFCDIVEGKINSQKIYEDEEILAFKDLNPQAPVHFLVIPKKHVKDLFELDFENVVLISKIFIVIKKIAQQQKLEEGFRVVSNCGEDGGQTVSHIHFHVLAKRKLAWPPG